MSIRHSLLALLEEQPRYGYQLKSEFEARTGDAWPLNIGQVYTTLDRLERDGLVAREGDDGEGHVIYAITAAGRAEAAGWFASPVEHANPPRNELAIKIALALTIPGVDVAAVVQTQRAASMRSLQDFTRARRTAAEHDVAWRLVLESLVFAAEAEIRWLDHCEATLTKSAGAAGRAGQAASSARRAATRAEAGR
ncbi:transcriptional regulator [Sinomonas cyclohexanicum]|uniref:Transcriptional regulator n=1 Tax=Sinomonas cyclohexanicum TaxID=322009 RepID=A0ABN6FDV4_SINCY|nr:PadR family transcriptional regulator [Corynebacterium cyclohexanicum]BCT74893.1 transcriptional regulator [Corynebacterium cyclohexanicum]